MPSLTLMLLHPLRISVGRSAIKRTSFEARRGVGRQVQLFIALQSGLRGVSVEGRAVVRPIGMVHLRASLMQSFEPIARGAIALQKPDLT
jgi:hypothetical protein